jgi:hypothetical protein
MLNKRYHEHQCRHTGILLSVTEAADKQYHDGQFYGGYAAVTGFRIWLYKDKSWIAALRVSTGLSPQAAPACLSPSSARILCLHFSWNLFCSLFCIFREKKRGREHRERTEIRCLAKGIQRTIAETERVRLDFSGSTFCSRFLWLHILWLIFSSYSLGEEEGGGTRRRQWVLCQGHATDPSRDRKGCARSEPSHTCFLTSTGMYT